MGNGNCPGFQTKKVQISIRKLRSVTTPAREAVLTRSPPLPPLSKDILSSTSSAASMAAMMLMSIHLQHFNDTSTNVNSKTTQCQVYTLTAIIIIIVIAVIIIQSSSSSSSPPPTSHIAVDSSIIAEYVHLCDSTYHELASLP